jgi:hypothetical protein
MSGYRPRSGLGVVVRDDTVYVAPLPDGPILVLEAVAAVIWVAACGGPASTTAERVAIATGLPVERVRADVDAFVSELVERHLLVAAD